MVGRYRNSWPDKPKFATDKLLISKPHQYSAFLRISKPLIDVSKRANLSELAYSCARKQRLIWKSAELETSIYCSDSSKTKNLQHNSLTGYYRHVFQTQLSLEQKQLIESATDIAKFPAIVASALRSLGYSVSPLHGTTYKVTREGAKAILQLSNLSTSDGISDAHWTEQFIHDLNSLKIRHQCDVGIYITPGCVSSQYRSLSKHADIFVLSGWEVIRLLHDTDILCSTAFQNIDFWAHWGTFYIR
jgi:hypothetical protein